MAKSAQEFIRENYDTRNIIAYAVGDEADTQTFRRGAKQCREVIVIVGKSGKMLGQYFELTNEENSVHFNRNK